MADELGFRKTYKMTGTPGFAGGPGETNLDSGASGSKRSNNAAKVKNAVRSSKVGQEKFLKDTKQGNFY
jgi:hypothetical protein